MDSSWSARVSSGSGDNQQGGCGQRNPQGGEEGGGEGDEGGGCCDLKGPIRTQVESRPHAV